MLSVLRSCTHHFMRDRRECVCFFIYCFMCKTHEGILLCHMSRWSPPRLCPKPHRLRWVWLLLMTNQQVKNLKPHDYCSPANRTKMLNRFSLSVSLSLSLSLCRLLSLSLALISEKIEGDFHGPRVLVEIGACELVSLLVWGRPIPSRWLRLLMLPPAVVHLHILLCKYLSCL